MPRNSYLFLFLLSLFLAEITFAQSTQRPPIPNVYLDCSGCDVTYIRTNVTFVNYVRDQDDADIYLRITFQRSAGGGREYVLNFSGMGAFEGQESIMNYSSPDTDSSDERRIGLTRYIKLGLLPFASNTTAVRFLDVIYRAPADAQVESEIYDPWNNWVFDVSVRSSMSGEENDFNFGLNGSFNYERTTEVWKLRGYTRGEINRRNLETNSGTININRDWADTWAMVGYSINEHTTLGLFGRAQFSRRGNLALNTYLAPAIEYNFFPYSEYQERRFIIQYQVTPWYRRYFETTIFLKDEELILSQELSSRLRYDQRWGVIDIRMSGIHYFHDTTINRIEINPSLNIRITRGLSVSISGRYRLINDQLAIQLPRNYDPNDPEWILRGLQRPTSYDYNISFGLSYTFGSIYNNIVNPRF